MTDDDGTKKIAEVVDGFSQMNARQQTIHKWSVTSWRNDSQTIHHVNLLKGSCTCKDKQYNRGDDEACAHIMKANHQAQGQMDAGEAINHDLHKHVLELRQHVQTIERRSAGVQADRAGDMDEAAAQESSEADDEGTEIGREMTEGVVQWLDEENVDTEHLGIHKHHHNGTGGVGIEPNKQEMGDKEYEWFKNVFKDDVPDGDWHLGFADGGCPNCDEKDDDFYAFIPAGDLPEVVG